MKASEISKKYELLDEIQHVLKRPGMYVGSTKPHKSTEFFLDETFVKQFRRRFLGTLGYILFIV